MPRKPSAGDQRGIELSPDVGEQLLEVPEGRPVRQEVLVVKGLREEAREHAARLLRQDRGLMHAAGRQLLLRDGELAEEWRLVSWVARWRRRRVRR